MSHLSAEELVSRFVRPEIRALTPYSTARTEGSQQNITAFLDANENPYPVYRESVSASSVLTPSAYPHPHDALLYQRMSEYLNVPEEQILITRGADEGIDVLTRALCPAQNSGVIISPPTFGMYEVYIRIQGAALHSVPLIRSDDVFSLDTEGILITCEQNPEIRLVFVCSPNNPTGNRLDTDDLLHLAYQLRERALLVVDEAYVAFSGAPSLAEHLAQHPNLVILRTLSKEASLAGARCGAVIAAPEITRVLSGVLAPYPLTTDTVHTVSTALSERGRAVIEENIARILKQRDFLATELRKLPCVKRVFPSDANFLLVEVDDATACVQWCEAHGVKIRDRSHEMLLAECVRISVGTPEQSKLLLHVLEQKK